MALVIHCKNIRAEVKLVTLNYNEVANLIAVVGGDTTAHEVRQRARCHDCGVKGNNTYQIKLRRSRVSVKHGPCKSNSKMGHAVVGAMAHVLAVLHAPKFLADTVTS